jgi:hypothetical protein
MIAVLNWLLNHWYVFFWLAVFGVFEGVRDFFIGMAEAVAGVFARHHERRIELAEAMRPAPVAASSAAVPGRCVHRRVVQIRTADGELVGWLCRKQGCERRLPPDWAVAAEDLPGGSETGDGRRG